MHALNVGAHRARVNEATVDPDFIVGVDQHEDIGVLRFTLSHRRVGPVYVKPDFLDKRRRHDEKDQHDKHDVEHRRQVDLVLFLFEMDIIQMMSHRDIPLVIHRQ
jgi:hypothetical protein